VTDFLSFFPEVEQQYGLPTGYLERVAHVESRMNPAAQNPNSSAGGLFQFIDSTARQYNLADRFDPRQATDAAARLARDNANTLRNVLGRDPTAGELYLAHQQGAGGASRLLRNPDAPAVSILGNEAFRLNGGRPGMTAADFAQRWIGKIDGRQPTMAMQAPPRGARLPNISPQDAETWAEAPPQAMGYAPANLAGMPRGPSPGPTNAIQAIAQATRGPMGVPASPVAPVASASPAFPQPRTDTFTGGSNMTDMAAEKPAPASVGGLGGLGGFQPMAGGKFGEMLQMIGMALLSSPGNAPLQNLPAMAFAMQDRRQKAEDRDFDRRRQSTLDEAALDDRRSSTEMRRLQMEQIRRAAEREQQDALILSGRAPSVGGAAPASPDVLAPAPMPQAAPAPGAQAAPSTAPASPIAAPVAAPVAQEPPSSPTDMQIQRLDRAMSDPRLSPQARQQLVEQKNKLLSNFTFQTRPDGSVLRIDKTDNSVREIRPAPQRLSDSDRGRVVEADDAVSTARSSLGAIDRAIQLNRESFSGALADTRAGIVANLPSWAPGRQTAVNTLELQNTMMRQVLSSLKTTFGGNPTEGERRILADVEGSVNAPVEIRESVLRRARAAAESAIARQSARSRGIRDGSYYRQPPEAAAEPPAAAPQATTAKPAQPAADPYAAARDAIRRGAPAEAVRERLRQNGLDPSRL
jgi:hypothetical protein